MSRSIRALSIERGLARDNEEDVIRQCRQANLTQRRKQCGRNEAICNCPIDHGGRDDSAQAADLPTAKAVEPTNAAPNCFGSLWDWLSTSISDCPLSYAGFTLYGTLDVGYGYDTAGVPFGNSYISGVYYGIQKTSRGGRWSWSPNALSPSTLGLKMEEPLAGDWLLIGAAEFGFNPYSGMLANGPRSFADNNLNPLANQIASGDGSRAGQWDNSQGFVGVSSKTYAR